MASFLQNIAPGAARLGQGYLSGQRATKEKLHEEETQRDRDALAAYMRLVESGQWEPVDPQKGATGTGVIAVGGLGWLQPRKISPWEEAKYTHEQKLMKFKEQEAERTVSESALERDAAAAKRAHDEKIQKLALERAQIEKEKASLAKVEKEPEDEYTNTESGMKYKLTRSRLNEIMVTPPAKLSSADKEIQRGVITGKIVAGEPTVLSERPLSERDKATIDKQNRERVQKLIIDSSHKDATSEEIMAYTEEANTLIADDASYVYAPVPQTKWLGMREDKPKMLRWPLPVARAQDGSLRQITVRDIRQRAQERGVTFEEQLRVVFQNAPANAIGVAK